MGKAIATIKNEKDIGPGLVVAAGLVLLLAKLFLAGAQQVFLWPDESVLDDMVMYDAAVSIAKGGWLGVYGFTTLAKNSFFALWLAGLHKLGIPFLLGGQLLWALASLAGAFAVYPVLKRRWAGLLLFGVLLFSPSSTANPVPYAFVTRVYRDNIFPALCVLCVAGMVGFALRLPEKPAKSVWWLALAGLAFGACWLGREDGWWLLPFVLGAALVCLVFIVRADFGIKEKAARAACLLLPFALCAACILGWSAANNAVYGRFIVNDFSSGEFADAYGAMTRIEHESWHPKVAVPTDVRQQLYQHVPAFAQLKPLLTNEHYLDKYAGKNPDGSFKDYSSGAFYWALREAAAELGYYDTPQKAEAFWRKMAAEINALCDDGTLAAGPRRSSVSPPIRAEYVGPVLREGLHSLWFCATFQDCDPRSLFSPGGNDPVFYEETLRPMEEFLHEKALTVTNENSTEPYFNVRQALCFAVLDAVRLGYAILLPAGLLAALCWQVLAGVQFFRRLARRQRQPQDSLFWILMLGLLLCVLLRAFMMAFVTVSSFNIGTFVMYLASIHPLLLLYAFLGVWKLVPMVTAKVALAISRKAV